MLTKYPLSWLRNSRNYRIFPPCSFRFSALFTQSSWSWPENPWSSDDDHQMAMLHLGSLSCIPMKLSFENSCPLIGNSETVFETLVCHLLRVLASWIKYLSFSTTPFLWNTDFWAMRNADFWAVSSTTSVWFRLQPVTLFPFFPRSFFLGPSVYILCYKKSLKSAHKNFLFYTKWWVLQLK